MKQKVRKLRRRVTALKTELARTREELARVKDGFYRTALAAEEFRKELNARNSH